MKKKKLDVLLKYILYWYLLNIYFFYFAWMRYHKVNCFLFDGIFWCESVTWVKNKSRNCFHFSWLSNCYFRRSKCAGIIHTSEKKLHSSPMTGRVWPVEYCLAYLCRQYNLPIPSKLLFPTTSIFIISIFFLSLH